MKELVLELVTSYEDRISAVEELIGSAYSSALAAEGSVGELVAERGKLKTVLQQTLARNCSLRRKDFDRLMDGICADFEHKRENIEDERALVVGKVKGYLGGQKALAASLRQRLLESISGNPDNSSLETIVASIRMAYQDAAGNLFILLREFQSDLQAFCKEQEEINGKLKRLVDRGESLRTEDIRRLEAAKTSQARKTDRELRRCEVERLLAHFKQHRENYGRQQGAT